MTNTINNNQLRNNAVPTDAKAKGSARGAAEATSASTGADASAKGGQSNPAAIVELSTTGLLQSIGEQIDKLPEVNEAKVASIKQSLAQGDYKTDADIIARKFTEIENLLP